MGAPQGVRGKPAKDGQLDTRKRALAAELAGAMQEEEQYRHGKLAGEPAYRPSEQIMQEIAVQPLKLDLGCGTRKQAGFIGVDIRAFDGVDQVVDLMARRKVAKQTPHASDAGIVVQSIVEELAPWPWASDSVEEVFCSHLVEHFDVAERIHFVNELYRVLVPGGKATIQVPHWNSGRAFGDLTHKWPPVAEFWFYYLSKEWRAEHAPHNDGYTCDFQVTWGYVLRSELEVRSTDYQMFALQNYKEAAQDIVATFTKK